MGTSDVCSSDFVIVQLRHLFQCVLQHIYFIYLKVEIKKKQKIILLNKIILTLEISDHVDNLLLVTYGLNALRVRIVA